MYSPKTANTTAKICTLKRDNLTVGDHWCLVGDDTVTICRQKTGASAEAEITMTKRDFNRIVKFYTTPTKDPPMTAPSLLDELDEVVRRITDDAAEVRRTGGDPERERHTQRIAVNFIRTHHAEIEAMARDAARYRKVRMGRSDWHGDVYAMTFAGCGDFPVCGDDLDVLADAMHDSAREGGE